MVSEIILVPYFIGFILFGVGLYSGSQLIGTKRALSSYSLLSKYQIPLRPLKFLISIVIFCGLCNLILIIPSMLEALFGIASSQALTFHQIGLVLLGIVSFLIVFVGAVAVLNLFRYLNYNRKYYKAISFSQIFLAIRIKRLELFFILLASLSYFYQALFLDSVIYDMGLYHLPFVKHLVKFGPEIGLANLHFRYGFYNIQLFGQTPLQAFAMSPSQVSPSLNIFFMAAAMIFACETIRISYSLGSKKIAQSGFILGHLNHFQMRSISIISYWFCFFVFGLDLSGSLFAYNADFSASVVAGIVIFALINGLFINSEIIFLVISLPLLKLSGVVAVVFAFLFMIILGSSYCMIYSFTWQIAFAEIKRKVSQTSLKAYLACMALLYVTYFTTNVSVSGYLVFPQYKTGPIAEHAFPYKYTVAVKDKWITGWARYGFDANAEDVIQNAPLKAWFPNFSKTVRGKKMLFWVGSSFVVAISSAIGVFYSRYKSELIVLFSSSVSMGIVGIIVLFVLPPEPRFYSWINGLSLFNSLQLILVSPFLGLVLFSFTAVGISVIFQTPMAIVKTPPMVIDSYARFKTFKWRTRSTADHPNLIIRKPLKGDQCWSAEPPCTTHREKSLSVE